MELDIRKYEKTVKWSDEDQVFIARAPKIPGCASHGDTEVEALKNLDEALSLTLDGLAELGLEKNDGISKFLVRMPAGLKNSLVKLSSDKETSINELIVGFVTEGIEFATAKRGSLSEVFGEMGWKRAKMKRVKKKHKKLITPPSKHVASGTRKRA